MKLLPQKIITKKILQKETKLGGTQTFDHKR